MIERWVLALARFLDRANELPEETRALNTGLRLFGITRFREGQLDAVLGALRGESMLVIRPTGGGKSLCYQLPAVLKGQPSTFVLAPLKALMVDQVMGLHDRQLPATFINGDVSGTEKEARYEMLEQGAWALFYVAPERFGHRVNPHEIARLASHKPSFLVVDEAHMIDRWGDDFRVAYSQIADIRRKLGDPPVLAYTATAGVRTQRRILESLGVPDARVLISDVDRPNIVLARVEETSDTKRAQIVANLLRQCGGRAIIFVPTKAIGREVQEALAAAGLDLPFFHGDLPTLERDSIFGRFTGSLDPPTQAVISTSAFSLGVDIPNIRVVVNWQHPFAVEDYLQEFGRAGRDGKPALALLFTRGGQETTLLNWMAERTSEDVVEQGLRTADQAKQTLQGKLARIDEVQAIARNRDVCFRAALNESLIAPRTEHRRPLARRTLDYVFSTRVRVEPAGICCDHCNPDIEQRIRAGTYVVGEKASLWGRVAASPPKPKTPPAPPRPKASPAPAPPKKTRRSRGLPFRLPVNSMAAVAVLAVAALLVPWGSVWKPVDGWIDRLELESWHVPDGLDCGGAEVKPPGANVGVDCYTPFEDSRSISVSYFSFDDRSAAKRHFRNRVRQVRRNGGLARGRQGGCRRSRHVVPYEARDGGRAFGRVLCLHTTAGPRFEWTDMSLGIYAVAVGDSYSGLYRWWRDSAGPKETDDDEPEKKRA